MAEYIEREAAKMAVVEALGKGHSPFNAIVMLPAADVVPVVRCRECKYWKEIYAIPFIGKCAFTPIRHTAEFFCASGERKDGDGDV